MLVDSKGWIGSCETQHAARLMLDHHHRDVWLYHFARLGNESTVGHFAEVPYVFQNCNSCGIPDRRCCQGSVGGTDDARLSSWMGRYWTSLAKHGDPNSLGMPHWPRYRHGAVMMQFDVPLRLQRHFRAEQCHFWRHAAGAAPPAGLPSPLAATPAHLTGLAARGSAGGPS